MSKKVNGTLVIADITGYTAFLSHSELEHAEDSLRSLLDLLINYTHSPLLISRLEGDAVISYAPDGTFKQGQTIIEMIENSYVAFRKAVDLMVVNTTCTCNACRNITNLDLKFFVHHGEFIVQEMPTHLELIGNDVNLIHRLTKNNVTEQKGIKAYTLYTQAAIQKLDLEEMEAQMIPHIEVYEHLGEIELCIQDMHEVWENQREVVRTSVQPEEAIYIIEKNF